MGKRPYIGSSNLLAPLVLVIDFALRSADKFCVCDFLQFGFSYFLSEDILQPVRPTRAVDEAKFLTFILREHAVKFRDKFVKLYRHFLTVVGLT
jgi:hypothetical protein